MFASFQMFGVHLWSQERLNVDMRPSMAIVPICFRLRLDILSKPDKYEFLNDLFVSHMSFLVKGCLDFGLICYGVFMLNMFLVLLVCG